MFEVDGGHGPTQWTRRRLEGTRPSRIDPDVAPNTARVSEKVTQEKKVHQRLAGLRGATVIVRSTKQGESAARAGTTDEVSLLEHIPKNQDTCVCTCVWLDKVDL